MEKHFVELKQEIFDTKLQVVTLNSTLLSPGGIRQDLLSIFFDDGSDVPEKRLHPEVYIVNSLSRSKFE